MKKLLLILLPYIIFSCNVLPIPSVQKSLSSTIELGVIGTVNHSLIQNQFQINAIPVLKQKIRVTVTTKQFDKFSTKRYNKFQQKESDKITFIDSLENHDNYIQLNLIDKVTLIEEINASHNKNVVTYLKTASAPLLITTITTTFSKLIQKNIINADALYLMNNRNKKYVLQLYKKGKLTETVEFSKANIFNYKTSNFCWIENDKHNFEISDISNERCSKNTYKNYNKAVKNKKEFKF
ncbi:MAG: hypothetical protein L3J08_08025 [Flavobacteriaceae bacterium]|nr:hypothetical protein [Flavobacteriaceae bacterium]